MEKRVLVTGGSGFIGSNFIRYLLKNEDISEEINLINIDKITYAGRGRNIEHIGISSNPRYSFVRADICDEDSIRKIISDYKPEIIFNFAAESHVDRSISDPETFERSNFLGACNLFNLALEMNIERIVQVSTDEVYGSIEKGSFSETSPLNPSSPYSSTKAAADLAGLSLFREGGLPIIITRSANNFGPYQFPEKILPLFITNLLQDKKVPLMWSEENPGLNVRDWIYVEDNCRAIWHAGVHGNVGEIYNIPGENERTNWEMTQIILNNLGFDEEMIEKIPHRKSHDFRYSVDGAKLKDSGFVPSGVSLDQRVMETIDWYKKNRDWWVSLK